MGTNKKLYLIGVGILGEIVLFCVLHEFKPVIGNDRLIVNLVFISLAYWLFLGQFINLPVTGKDNQSKWVGSLGIHLHGLAVYFLATLSAVYISNAVFCWSSRWQLYVHLGIIAIFLFYNFLSRTANEHVGEVYVEERKKMKNVKNLKQISSSVKINVSLMDNIPAEVSRQLSLVDENIQDLVPLCSVEALQLEKNIGEALLHIESYLSNTQDNKQAIVDTFRLVSTYMRRRQLLTD